jgi:hypothetical protein
VYLLSANLTKHPRCATIRVFVGGSRRVFVSRRFVGAVAHFPYPYRIVCIQEVLQGELCKVELDLQRAKGKGGNGVGLRDVPFVTLPRIEHKQPLAFNSVVSGGESL